MKHISTLDKVILAVMLGSMALLLAPRAWSDDDMVLVPAGEFVMGSDQVGDQKVSAEYGNTKPWYLDEHPRHKENLPAYYMDKYEVSNLQYREFVAKNKHNPPTYWLETGYLLSLGMDKVKQQSEEKLRKLITKVFRLDVDTRKMNHDQLLAAIAKRIEYMDHLPVVSVSWYDADAFCRSIGKRLPTEAEWEKAARGQDGSEFPWGQQWRAGMSNSGDEFWDDGVAPVGSYKTDVSPFKIYDLAGNVSEWVENWYQPYSGSDYQSDNFGKMYKVMRGAAWGREGHYAISLFQRGAYRFYLTPDSTHADLGFRCARDATAH